MTMDEIRNEPVRSAPVELPDNLLRCWRWFIGSDVCDRWQFRESQSWAVWDQAVDRAANCYITSSAMVTCIARRDRTARERVQRKQLPWYRNNFRASRAEAIQNRWYAFSNRIIDISDDVVVSLKPYPVTAFPAMFQTYLGLQSLVRFTPIPPLPGPWPPLTRLYG